MCHIYTEDAHVLLNLLNELRKSSSILSLFRKRLNKFINKRVQMLHSIYHMTLKLFCNYVVFFGVKTSSFGHIYATSL